MSDYVKLGSDIIVARNTVCAVVKNGDGCNVILDCGQVLTLSGISPDDVIKLIERSKK
jgi:hypothetical protein